MTQLSNKTVTVVGCFLAVIFFMGITAYYTVRVVIFGEG